MTMKDKVHVIDCAALARAMARAASQLHDPRLKAVYSEVASMAKSHIRQAGPWAQRDDFEALLGHSLVFMASEAGAVEKGEEWLFQIDESDDEDNDVGGPDAEPSPFLP